MIYLDTHVVIWLYLNRIDLLSETAQRFIEANSLLISPMVLLEIEYLYEIERVKATPRTIYDELSNSVDLKLCERKFSDVIFQAMNIRWTRDPFDRILVAQASLGGDPLISKDRELLENYEQTKW